MTASPVQLRHLVQCLDALRIPLNKEQRNARPGPVPYWGAGGIVDHVDVALFDENLVLLGEDGAPFFDPLRPVAFHVTGPTWVNNHIHVLRPGPAVDARFLAYALNAADYGRYITGSTRDKLTQDDMKAIRIPLPQLEEQRRLADALDQECRLLDRASSVQGELLRLLDERIDSQIGESIVPALAGRPGHPMVPLKWLLRKVVRPATSGSPIVTAFRDGQVVARSERRADGFTESWTDAAVMQEVRTGDVVVHGLDGFAGAVGTSESNGSCSPANHVCEPVDGGDADFYGRMLRIFATSGYLSLYGGSSRERAVDFRNWASFSRIPLPVVAVERQQQIGEMIRAGRALRPKTSHMRSLLAEKKTSLIAAAVMAIGGGSVAGYGAA